MKPLLVLTLILVFTVQSCSNEETASNEQFSNDSTEEEGQAPIEAANDCPDSVGFVFEEANGIVSIEFENNDFPEGWVLKNDVSGVSGQGYMQWEGNPSLGNPGSGMISFPIRIANTGTYRFLWKSSYRMGNNGTEHNDSWLRFPDADDFFGMKNDDSVVYPNDIGKQPNPNGASKDGWFKVYRSGNNSDFKWQANTSDNDAHGIYITFEAPGVFRMEISARSDFHAIDRILMYKENISQDEAVAQADNFSVKHSCN